MKLKTILLSVALIGLGATSAFAAKADHASAMEVSTSLLKSIKTDDFECFNDTLSPQLQAMLAAQEDPQKLFTEFSKTIRKALEQVPEEQRPLVSMMMAGQFQRLAQKVDGKWYIDAAALAGGLK